jgi:ABC-type dipeptide/oligopeptide/nickel transport system permease subunit
MVLVPGAVLALAIMAVNLFGDAVRDALEPLRGRPLA